MASINSVKERNVINEKQTFWLMIGAEGHAYGKVVQPTSDIYLITLTEPRGGSRWIILTINSLQILKTNKTQWIFWYIK